MEIRIMHINENIDNRCDVCTIVHFCRALDWVDREFCKNKNLEGAEGLYCPCGVLIINGQTHRPICDYDIDETRFTNFQTPRTDAPSMSVDGEAGGTADEVVGESTKCRAKAGALGKEG